MLEWDPPHRLVLAWHPGFDADSSARVEVRFSDEDGSTQIDLRHDGWEAFGEQALRRRRDYIGPSAWGHVLDHYAHGAEPPRDEVDLSELTAAYDTFFAAAESARTQRRSPSSGADEWGVEQVVAHVALNDLAMIAVAQALVHRGEPVFENRIAQDRTTLDAFVDASGDLDALIAVGRRCAVQSVAAVRLLDEDQRSNPVHCRLEDGGETRLDEPMPWGRVAIEIQATRHLPSHTEQLRALLR